MWILDHLIYEVIIHNESAAGVQEGGRTGKTPQLVEEPSAEFWAEAHILIGNQGCVLWPRQCFFCSHRSWCQWLSWSHLRLRLPFLSLLNAQQLPCEATAPCLVLVGSMMMGPVGTPSCLAANWNAIGPLWNSFHSLKSYFFDFCKVRDIDFSDLRIALPAFLTICITPLAYASKCGATNWPEFEHLGLGWRRRRLCEL